VKNWDTVQYYADCPLIEGPKGCYKCSDGLVIACYVVNKEQITGEKKE